MRFRLAAQRHDDRTTRQDEKNNDEDGSNHREQLKVSSFFNIAWTVVERYRMIDQASRYLQQSAAMNALQQFGRFLIWVSVLLGLTNCSIVAEYPVYVAKATDPRVATREYSQPPIFTSKTKAFEPSDAAVRYGSLTFSTDEVCLLVYETEIVTYRTLFIGPPGCPCFPLLFFNDLPERPDLFHVAFLFVTRHKEHGFVFDPLRIVVRQQDGTVMRPESIKAGRIRTKWEEVCRTFLLFFKSCWLVERTAEAEELHVEPSMSEGGHELWDWTAFKMSFRKPQEKLFPIHVSLDGLSNRGHAYKLDDVDLIPGKGRIGYVYPRDPSKVMGRASSETCRSSWKDKPGIS